MTKQPVEKWILLSTTDNPTYLEFLPSACTVWRRVHGFKVSLGFVTYKTPEHPLITEIRDYVDDLHIERPIAGVCSQALGKLFRYYLCTHHQDAICVVMDIDMYMIDLKYLCNLDVPDMRDAVMRKGKILTIGFNMYDRCGDIKSYKGVRRFPAAGMTCRGRTMVKLLDMRNKTYAEYVLQFKPGNGLLERVYDNDDISTFPFSDEALLVQMIVKQSMAQNIVYFKREPLTASGHSTRRLDRSMHGTLNSAHIEQLLKSGNYEDVCPPRPFDIVWMTPILDYLRNVPNDMRELKYKQKSIGILGITHPCAQQMFQELCEQGEYVCFADPKRGVGVFADIFKADQIHVYGCDASYLVNLVILCNKKKMQLVIHNECV